MVTARGGNSRTARLSNASMPAPGERPRRPQEDDHDESLSKDSPPRRWRSRHLACCSPTQPQPEMVAADGSAVGKVTFGQVPTGVLIYVEIDRLPLTMTYHGVTEK